MKQKIILIFMVIFVFNFEGSLLLAQEPCPIDTLVIKEIKGSVKCQSKKNLKEFYIPDAKVELFKDKEPYCLISTEKTDENGYFIFKKVKPGKYILKVSHPYFVHLSVPIEKIDPNEKRKEILNFTLAIYLGVDFNSHCGGGRAELKDSTN